MKDLSQSERKKKKKRRALQFCKRYIIEENQWDSRAILINIWFGLSQGISVRHLIRQPGNSVILQIYFPYPTKIH